MDYRRRVIEADTSEYIQDGLILHWDGINNTGDGHDPNSSVIKDLSGNGYDLIVTASNCEIGSDYFKPLQRMTCSKLLDNIHKHFELVCLSYVTASSSIIRAYGNVPGTLWLGGTGQVLYPSAQATAHYGVQLEHGNDEASGIINSASMEVAHHPSIAYLNGAKLEDAELFESTGQWQSNIQHDYWFTYSTANDSVMNHRIYSLRLYNRVLTDYEILHNYSIDQRRFNINVG